MDPALSIVMGRTAADVIRERGWSGAPFKTLIGASGGPKWLILSELDQVLATELLPTLRSPLTLLGSSIGTWRHACISQPDPVIAIRRLQRAYLHQEHSRTRPSAQEVSQVAETMLREVLDTRGQQHLIDHPRLHNAIVTARARGVARARGGLPLLAGLGAAGLGNAIHRFNLALFFQRVVFAHSALTTVPFAQGFNTARVALNESNLVSALKASGAIPFLMRHEPHIPGAGDGPFWDGGIIDYHFSLNECGSNDGLILYPHFRRQLIPGWFDKALPWRHRSRSHPSNLVLMYPSKAFLAQLPFGKIPDRRDFRSLTPAARIHYWETCIRDSGRLAEELYNLLTGDDPLRGVKVID